MLCILFWLGFSHSARADWADRAWDRTIGPPGAAYVILKGDSVFAVGGLGLANPNEDALVDVGTVFRAASLGKTVVAMGIFQLIEAGQLSLTTRIDSVLPDLATSWGWGPELQVCHLLEHSSGLGDMRFNEYHVDQEMELAVALQVNANSKALRWSPGRTASYSNIGYAVLALVGERISGKAWKVWLEESVLQPVGMEASGFGQVGDLPNHAVGYANGKAIQEPVYLYGPSLSFYTSISDWSKLLQCLLQQGRPVLEAGSVLRMEAMRTTPAGRSGIEVGYGAGIQSDYVDGWLCRYHTGKVEGFTAVYEYFPAQNAGFAVLYNGKSAQSIRTTPLVHACRSRCVRRQDLPDRPLFLKNPVKKLNPEEFAGTYAFANPRNEVPGFYDEWMLEVAVEWKGDWTFLIGGEEWFWIGSGRLVKSGAIHAGAVLGVDPDTGQRSLTVGKLYYLQGGGAVWRKAFRWTLWVFSGLMLVIGLWVWYRTEEVRLGWYFLLVLPIVAGESALKWMLACDPTQLGEVSFNTLGVFVLSGLVLLFTVIGLVALMRAFKAWQSKWYYWTWVLLGILDLIFCWALWQRDVIGFALWSY